MYKRINKMKTITTLIVMCITIVFTGCGSPTYNYTVKPTPIKQKESKFYLSKFNFTLDDSDRNSTSKFIKESAMKEEFRKSINEFLKKKNILGSNSDFSLELTMHYIRNYYYMGNSSSHTSIQLPHFYYEWKVYDKTNKLLATYEIPESVIDYGMLKSHIVNFQILAGERKAKHEIEDIRHISKFLVKKLEELGK